MSQTRTPDECRDELTQLDQAHLQNETARDSFIAVAHTALFAASIAFIGDVVAVEDASASWAVKTAWVLNASGLIALSASYPLVSWHIAKRRDAVYDPDQPNCRICAFLNWTALTAFPLSVIALLWFVLANVGGKNERSITEIARDPTLQSGTRRPTERSDASFASPKSPSLAAPSASAALRPSDKRVRLAQ